MLEMVLAILANNDAMQEYSISWGKKVPGAWYLLQKWLIFTTRDFARFSRK
jgi:hypothetical protein